MSSVTGNLASIIQNRNSNKEASFQILTQTKTSSLSPELKGKEGRGGSLLHESAICICLTKAALVWSKTINGFEKKIHILKKTFNSLNSMFIKFHYTIHFS